MLLVPRQLLRAGMTGNVPYYGGRFTPEQAYAASHPHQPPPEGLATPLLRSPTSSGRAPVPAANRPTSTASDSERRSEQTVALQQLLDAAVITPEEYQRLLARVSG